ncbi:hypothetical protein [Modestobacter sp. Leaf380]|nr:hypothetical protein [Modestobacter sp. Leaf380]
MTEPEKDDAETQLHAGPRDEGGEGGMATRELKAHEAEEGEPQG